MEWVEVSATQDAATSTPGTPYRVLILGAFGLERDGVRIDTGRWQSRVQALFKLLVTAPDRQRRREELMDLLWPEGDPATVAGNLRILVHRLRLTLGGEPSPVLSGGGWISLNPAYGWELDLEQMEHLAGEANGDVARLESAVALYRGEPLIEDRYEAWAAPLLVRAQRVWRDAALQLAGIYRARGQYATAALWFERLLEVDPLDEEAMQGELAMLRHSGQPAEALRRYQKFKEYLQAELDTAPAAETQLLIETIKQQLGAESARVESLPEHPLPIGAFLGALPEGVLIDRRDELERAIAASDAARAGTGSVVVLSGEAGVGKTRLAQEVMLHLRAGGFLVLTTYCYERERAVPFAPFLDLLALAYAAAPPAVRIDAGHRWPQLAWLLPEGTVSVPEVEDDLLEEPDQQRVLFRACSEFLGTMARERPLVLMLDDMQWADDGSLDLLHFLARETHGLRVLLLLSYRDADISRDHPLAKVVRDMAREGLTDRITLGRLGPDETAALVNATFGDVGVPAEFNDFVYRRTKGNPFFVKKMVEALGGRYRLVRQIAVGGMGRVFEAVDTGTGEHVAAKLMFARSESDPRAFLRFQQEAHVLAALDHPNIVRVFGAFAEEHASCIIMELIAGSSIAEVMEREHLSLARVRHIALQVTAALAGAHERGIVHRDIKPDNIMLGDDDRVKVTDFGIARLMRPLGVTTLTATGMTMGTPLYMSPEQIQAGEIDSRTDIYSLGAVLYRMVTGRLPFAGDDPVSVAYQHVHEPPVPPSVLRPELPEAWDSVIIRALAKNPDERYQTAVAMARALEAVPDVASARPQSALIPAAPVRYLDVTTVTARKGNRNRGLIWRTVPALVLLVAVALLGGRALGLGASGGGTGLLSGPTGIALSAKGFLYVVDADNNRVREFSPAGASVDSLGSFGPGILQFNTPSDIAVRPPDRLYVSDAGNKRILVIQGRREVNDMQFDVGSLALDRYGNVYGTDYGHAQIRKFRGEGPAYTSIPIPGVYVSSFSFPAGIAIGSAGQIYIADRLHNGVVVVSDSGAQHLFFGRKDDQPGKAPGEFNTPSDVTLDRRGNVYVADTYNNRVQKLTPSGEPLAVWGSTRVRHFDLPTSIAVDAHGNVYVSEHYAELVMKLSPSGRLIWSTDGEHVHPGSQST